MKSNRKTDALASNFHLGLVARGMVESMANCRTADAKEPYFRRFLEVTDELKRRGIMQ